jgi:hypothetical protein
MSASTKVLLYILMGMPVALIPLGVLSTVYVMVGECAYHGDDPKYELFSSATPTADGPFPGWWECAKWLKQSTVP